MTVSDIDERRKYLRVGFSTAIRIHIEADGEQFNIKGNSRDLSLKGIFINTRNRFSSGTKCAIRIYLTGGIDEIELVMKGTVVRVTDNGMGIGFDSMDLDSYSHLKNIVKYNCMDNMV